MSQVTTPTEPGWLPDPSGRYEWRYWDGGWTNRVANSSPAARPPSQAPRALTAGSSAAPGVPSRPAPSPQRAMSSGPRPSPSNTAPPPTDSELAVLAAVRSG